MALGFFSNHTFDLPERARARESGKVGTLVSQKNQQGNH